MKENIFRKMFSNFPMFGWLKYFGKHFFINSFSLSREGKIFSKTPSQSSPPSPTHTPTDPPTPLPLSKKVFSSNFYFFSISTPTPSWKKYFFCIFSVLVFSSFGLQVRNFTSSKVMSSEVYVFGSLQV